MFLLCSTGKEPSLNSEGDVCLSIVSYKGQEYCNFFKTETLMEASNSLLIAGECTNFSLESTVCPNSI